MFVSNVIWTLMERYHWNLTPMYENLCFTILLECFSSFSPFLSSFCHSFLLSFIIFLPCLSIFFISTILSLLVYSFISSFSSPVLFPTFWSVTFLCCIMGFSRLNLFSLSLCTVLCSVLWMIFMSSGWISAVSEATPGFFVRWSCWERAPRHAVLCYATVCYCMLYYIKESFVD